ncbi:Ger(x)C family spore germination protein [Clostridium manihotivorum]|uniref:Ger(X)C family spore germination protein n=1 Tax=Clostridium manihotivorum TaxID=2320868 RepID=A0A3R5QY44_9CLOT|nr:Ger(x)C family spore germination protein [Clostridium manihotivorum]QAA34966.1 hypothetical protein C1I91_26825 [Clostridium manihotivorum]
MMKRISRLLIIIMICNLLGGCWGAKEPSQLSLITALGIDKVKEKYLVTVQILNTDKVASDRSGADGTAVTTYRMEGKSLEEAIRRLSLEIPRQFFLGHLRMLVFGEDFAREGIGTTLDYLLRNSEIRSDFYIAVLRGKKATDALNVLTPLDQNPANKLFQSIENSEKIWVATTKVRLFDLIEMTQSEGIEPILTSIIVTGDTDIGMSKENINYSDVPANIQLGPVAAFKGDKLIGWLNDSQSALVNIIRGSEKGFLIIVPWVDPKEFINLTAENLRKTITVEEVMGKPKIIVNMKIKASIAEATGVIPIDKPGTIKQIERKTEDYLVMRFSKSTSEIQDKFKTDIFGFGRSIKIHKNKLWKKVGKNWDNEFPIIPVEYKVKVEITTTGTTTKSLKPTK